MQEFAPGVVRLPILFVNAYFIEIPHDGWVLVDSGLPKAAGVVRAKAEERFGKESRPKAIILTHGHVDHAGSARELAEGWNVPIYAHKLEVPYLSQQSDYPPHDPTIGGAIAQMSRLFPHKAVDLGRICTPCRTIKKARSRSCRVGKSSTRQATRPVMFRCFAPTIARLWPAMPLRPKTWIRGWA